MIELTRDDVFDLLFGATYLGTVAVVSLMKA